MSQAGVANSAGGGGGGASSFVTNMGTATPVAGVIDIVGGVGIMTSATGNTVTITNTAVASNLTFDTDSTPATSSGNAITFHGVGGLLFSGTGATVTGTLAAIPNASLANSSVTVTAGTGLSGGGTVSLGGTTTLSLTTPVSPANGGTGVNNGSSTLTLGGNLATSGAFATTFTMTAGTSVTFPTSGTLATTSQLPTLPLSLANGGTGASLVASNGGIFYSNASTGAILLGTATAGQLLQSGASLAPTWTTTTYPATNAINTLLYASAANVMSALATANNGVLITSAAGVPSILAAGSTGQVLTATTGSPPSWASPATSGTVTSVSGTANQVAVATGTTTPVISLIGPYTPATYTAHGVLIGEGTSSIVALGAGTAGQLLQAGGAGVDPAYSTTTYPASNAINTLLYASAANVMSALATVDGGTLVTSAAGVPTWLAAVAAGQVLISAGVSTPPVWSATPVVTGVTFPGAGGTGTTPTTDTQSSYEFGTFLPTLNGAVSGTTTYTNQNGFYVKIGNLVTVSGQIVITAATGTGNAQLGALPFTSNSGTGNISTGSIKFSATGWTWPTSATYLVLQISASATIALIEGCGSVKNSQVLQMTNAAASFTFNMTYLV